MPPPCNPLNMPLWALPGTWLHIQCSHPAHNGVIYPLKLLAEDYGHHHLLREMLPRFRCKSCGQRPAKAMLCETPYPSGKSTAGSAPGWRVPLTI
jgi:hypothetical protein